MAVCARPAIIFGRRNALLAELIRPAFFSTRSIETFGLALLLWGVATFFGYLLGAGLMLFAAVVEALFGVAAEGKSLESVAEPLSRAKD